MKLSHVVSALVVLMCASAVLADEMMPLPDFGNTFSSASRTRGYWFEAPVDFVMTGLRVPDESNHGLQNDEVVRFDGALPPPAWPGPGTNAFLSLARFIGEPSANILPVNIPVSTGDVIGILGACGDASMMHNSYGTPAGPFVTEILGQPTTLTRMILQSNLVPAPASDLMQEVPLAIARVEMYYVPEPATLGLLGLAGIALLRRR